MRKTPDPTGVNYPDGTNASIVAAFFRIGAGALPTREIVCNAPMDAKRYEITVRHLDYVRNVRRGAGIGA